MLLSRSLKLAVLGCAILAAGCDRQSGEAAQQKAAESGKSGGEALSGQIDRSQKGTAIPNFTLVDPQGKQLKLQSLKGKPLLVNLWATWCGPCVAELPMLGKLAADRAGDLKVLVVSQDTQTEKVAAFLAEHGGSKLEPWLDPKNDLTFHYGTGTLPTTVLYDAEGREVWRYVGAHDWSNAETTEMVKEGLAAR